MTVLRVLFILTSVSPGSEACSRRRSRLVTDASRTERCVLRCFYPFFYFGIRRPPACHSAHGYSHALFLQISSGAALLKVPATRYIDRSIRGGHHGGGNSAPAAGRHAQFQSPLHRRTSFAHCLDRRLSFPVDGHAGSPPLHLHQHREEMRAG